MTVKADPNTLTTDLRVLDHAERGPSAGGLAAGEQGRAPNEPLAAITPGELVALAGKVALALLAAGGLVALAVHLMLAGEVRAGLGFRFPGVPATVETATTILARNLRALASVLVVLAVAQLWARRSGAQDGLGVMCWLLLALLELLLALLELLVAVEVTLNVLVVGGALGAYGTRMMLALLPHGPVELAGFAVTLALLLAGRRRALPVRNLAGWTAVSVALLALAAILETWVVSV